MIDITGFLKTATLLQVNIGDPIALLHSRNPDIPFEEKRFKSILIHKHKSEHTDIEFYSEGGVINCIIIALWGGEKYQLSHAPFILSGTIDLYAFTSLLDNIDISWSINKANTSEKVLCLTLTSRVNCFFDLDVRELLKIGVGHS